MNRVLFMIIHNQIQYLQNSAMDHKEWYDSLGLDPALYESIVRGYVIENKIVFFKGITFQYDEEVIRSAKMFAPHIRQALQNETLEVYCGILINPGQKWEPILKISNEEIASFVPPKSPEEKIDYSQIQTENILEFKNDIKDPKICKNAIMVTGVILVLEIIIKAILFSKQEILHLNNPMDVLLSFSQIGLLGFIIFCYMRQKEMAKYLGLVVSVLMILTFDLFDIILGIFYFTFSIDQSIFIKFIERIKGKKGNPNVQSNPK